MQFRPLRVEGAIEVTPRQFPDSRGMFAEGFRADKLAEHIGFELAVRQTNISVSSAGAVRGIHYASLPPSQAKYVTALSGVFLDFIVDIRVGSPTFGQWDVVRLDTVDRRAVYLSEGLGHALACLEDGTARSTTPPARRASPPSTQRSTSACPPTSPRSCLRRTPPHRPSTRRWRRACSPTTPHASPSGNPSTRERYAAGLLRADSAARADPGAPSHHRPGHPVGSDDRDHRRVPRPAGARSRPTAAHDHGAPPGPSHRSRPLDGADPARGRPTPRPLGWADRAGTDVPRATAGQPRRPPTPVGQAGLRARGRPAGSLVDRAG